jgi:hypothetical protein
MIAGETRRTISMVMGVVIQTVRVKGDQMAC